MIAEHVVYAHHEGNTVKYLFHAPTIFVEADLQVVTDNPEPDFAELAAAALNNVAINANDHFQAVQ